MFVSYQWLRELTGTTLVPTEIRERLTNIGLAVDAVEERNGDFVLDVEVPSNRGDCLSHVGIARELAVIEKSQVATPESRIIETNGKASDFTSVEIRDPELCPRYAARIVRGVKILPSPEWLARCLETIGQRPINNVADITNYVLHEYGQPLHAFDLARLNERRIVVRRAAKGESIKTLDGEDRKLDEKMLVIADAARPVAVAGVMGGEDSEISDHTTDVLIESAYFNPSSVRRTAKLLGLHTEASHRFERGVDPEGVLRAQTRCVELICELAGGVATVDALDAYPLQQKQRKAHLRLDRVKAITGVDVAYPEIVRILTALGFDPFEDSEGRMAVTIPSWRHDVSIEEDLVEEVVRHAGYERIGVELPPSQSSGQYHFSEKRKRALRRALRNAGYDEAIDFSFIELTNEFELIPEFAKYTEENVVILANPIIEEASRMRQTLLSGLLDSVRHNFNHGIRNVCLFELGRLFATADAGELPREREALALVATGGVIEAGRAEPQRQIDFFDFKGALEEAFAALGLPLPECERAEIRHLRPGQAATISVNGNAVGSIGRLSETIADRYKFRQAVFVAEVDLTRLMEEPEQPVLYQPLPRYPAIVRDVSLLIDRKIDFAEIKTTAIKHPAPYFVGVTFVGTYEGEGIADDKRSLTLRFEYRSEDRTLRDEEVDASHWPLVKALQERFSAEIR